MIEPLNPESKDTHWPLVLALVEDDRLLRIDPTHLVTVETDKLIRLFELHYPELAQRAAELHLS